MDLKLVSWNILAQSTIPEAVQDTLAWRKRLPCIVAYLKHSSADFICLQEVNLDTFETDFKELLSVYQYARHEVCLKGRHKRTNVFGNATLWKLGCLRKVCQKSRTLHVSLTIKEVDDFPLCISNVHFPAEPGYDGYVEKCKHLASCVSEWKDENVIVAGDFNDGLSFRNEQTERAGLYNDFTALGFSITENELEKLTCNSFRGHVYNVDHVLSRLPIVTSYVSQHICIETLPSAQIPSDHAPIFYRVAIKS